MTVAEQLPPLARRLKQLREAAGMSQQSLAVAAGLSVGMVSQIEQGRRENPRVATLTVLADVLGITLDDLMSGGEQKPRRKRGGK
jgi:transcriptional regulator with XRE-family HTH domain